jgi:4-hydroxy-tetrahydrodipicolinate reductase
MAHFSDSARARAPRDPLRVLVLGAGRMGAGIARLVREKPGAELAGLFARQPRPAGTDAGQVIGLDEPIGLPVDHDLGALLERTNADVAVQATCSRIEDAVPEICALAEAGLDVISIAEEMAFPAYRSPGHAGELDRLACERGVTVLGTGVNPGFVLDLLVILLTGACARVRHIAATRVNDLSAFGPTVLDSQGVGLSPERFHAGVEAGTVTGHHGFPESMAMIATALGWRLDRVEQRLEPIVSRVRRHLAALTVEPGQVAGCLHRATGYVDGEPVIEFDHPQQVLPQLAGVETGDEIVISGAQGSELRLTVRPEIPGGEGTVALAVNMIPRVLAAPPGLACMADLPVPAAAMGELRGLAGSRTRAALASSTASSDALP